MNNMDIETDAVEVMEKFRKFTSQEMKKSLTSAVRKAGRQLVKETKKSLKTSVKNTNKHNPKYNDTLQQGVRMTRVYVTNDGTIATKVRIDSNNKTGSGSFRLMILEKGNYKTRPRYAYKRTPGHKLAHRGNVRAYNFFSTTRDKFLSEYDKIFTKSLDESVDKINNKKFGK